MTTAAFSGEVRKRFYFVFGDNYYIWTEKAHGGKDVNAVVSLEKRREVWR